MVEEIENDIQEVTAENDSANQALTHLEDWNDSDLDQALVQRKRFEELTRRLEALNTATIRAFNQNQEETYRLLPVMKVLLEACERNLATLRESKIAVAVESTTEAFQVEVDQLQENIDDFVLIHDDLANDEEWQNLLSQL